MRRGKLLPWRTAAECIDWSLPCPSIFDSKPEIMARYGLRAQRPLAANTMARVARGMARYVLGAERPFLISIESQAKEPFAIQSYRPMMDRARTGGSSRPGAGRTSPATSERMDVTAGETAPFLTRFNGSATGSELREPAPTVTANGWIRRPGGAAPLGLIAPLLTYAQQGGRSRQMDLPHHTICASRKDQNAVIVPGLVHIGNGERPGQAPRCLDPHAPLGTIVAAGPRQYPFAAFLAQQNGGPRMAAHAGHDPLSPMSTIAGTGSQQTPVAAFFAKYYGAGTGAATDAPAHTVTVNDRFGHVQAALAAPPFAPEHRARARQVAEFLRAHDAWAGGEFVTLEIDGQTFVVVDIGLRMLTPRELFTAQGFPPDYIIEGVWRADEEGEWAWCPFPGHVQISCCGNSVCPQVAAAIVGANCQHLVEEIAA